MSESGRVAIHETFLLDRARGGRGRFASLRPSFASSAKAVRAMVGRASRNCRWISYDRELTDALIQSVPGTGRQLGEAVLLHSVDPKSLPALMGCFRRIAFADREAFLPTEELAEVLQAQHRADLFIGGVADMPNRTIALWRGTLEPLVVPFSAFEVSGDGTVPDFGRLAVMDFGQTIQLGEYEASADAILYEFDPKFRRRKAEERKQSDRSFGASIRRLRKLRGLRREDFEPELSSKTIARIEQGRVLTVHRRTRQALAKRLGVQPEEIPSY